MKELLLNLMTVICLTSLFSCNENITPKTSFSKTSYSSDLQELLSAGLIDSIDYNLTSDYLGGLNSSQIQELNGSYQAIITNAKREKINANSESTVSHEKETSPFGLPSSSENNLQIALVDLSQSLKSDMENNQNMMLFMAATFRKYGYSQPYEWYEQVELVPSNSDSRNIVLSKFNKWNGGNEKKLANFFFGIGMSISNAKVLASYTVTNYPLQEERQNLPINESPDNTDLGNEENTEDAPTEK